MENERPENWARVFRIRACRSLFLLAAHGFQINLDLAVVRSPRIVVQCSTAHSLAHRAHKGQLLERGGHLAPPS